MDPASLGTNQARLPGDSATDSISTFVRGPCNDDAFLAAFDNCTDAGQSSPFLVHGSHGTGKTHLLRALCRWHLGKQKRVLYWRGADLPGQIRNALDSKATKPLLQSAYDSCDVLAIDDVHEIANVDWVQSELFDLLECFSDHRKWLLISTLKPPRSYEGFPRRIRSRLQSGLVTHLQEVDEATRERFLIDQARRRRVDLPRQVAHLMARTICGNFPETTGALNSLLALARARRRKVTLELAKTVLDDLFDGVRQEKRTMLSAICETVESYFDVDHEQLVSRSKARASTFPRQVAMYLARRLTHLSLADIGGEFGGRDHSTVHYALHRVEERAAREAKTGALLVALEKRASAAART